MHCMFFRAIFQFKVLAYNKYRNHFFSFHLSKLHNILSPHSSYPTYSLYTPPAPPFSLSGALPLSTVPPSPPRPSLSPPPTPSSSHPPTPSSSLTLPLSINLPYPPLDPPLSLTLLWTPPSLPHPPTHPHPPPCAIGSVLS